MEWNAHAQEVTAFHESSHAFVHHFYGHRVELVEIGKGSGQCRAARGWVPNEKQIRELCQREALLQLAICCCAGKAAMDRLKGRRKDGRRHGDYGWKRSDDRAQALKHCLQISGGDEIAAEHLLAYAMRRAELIVDGQWPRIHKLAFELLEHLKLDAGQIEKTLA